MEKISLPVRIFAILIVLAGAAEFCARLGLRGGDLVHPGPGLN